MSRRFMDLVHEIQDDDHRYYHQCRINQTLHLVSAISFLVAYAMVFFNPAAAGLIGWLVGMVTRQSGHIFTEPRGFDRIHNVSYEYKESIMIGYNMRRKAMLICVWLAIPLLLLASPSLFGLIQPVHGFGGYLHSIGLAWFALGVAGLLLRTVHLVFLRGPVWALAWFVKILIDPFHNVAIYWRSPLALMRGERYDPIAPIGASD